jgi:hypothetical protein
MGSSKEVDVSYATLPAFPKNAENNANGLSLPAHNTARQALLLAKSGRQTIEMKTRVPWLSVMLPSANTGRKRSHRSHNVREKRLGYPVLAFGVC